MGAWGEVARAAGGARCGRETGRGKASPEASGCSKLRSTHTEASGSDGRWRKLAPSDPRQYEFLPKIKLKSLILAQIERWRHALHMQVERQRGGNPGGERRTGE